MPCRAGVTPATDGLINKGDEDALCYEGRCPTRSSHCRALWGPNARTADPYCYKTLNKNTDSACGEGKTCEEE